MKAKIVKKTTRRATRKPAVVKLAVKSTPKRAVRFSLVMVPMGVAAFVIAFALSMMPFWASVSNAEAVTIPNCSQGIGSPLLVDVTQQISNDPDSGFHGDWAIDNFTRHIRIWAEGDHYCGQADDNGTFTTFGGASGVSPQSGAALPEVVTGTMVGSTHGVLTGTLGDANSWGVTGTAPAQDCHSTDCSMTSLWVNNYFPGGNYAYSPSPADSTGDWSWTYTADPADFCGYGSWTNANAGSSGDIAEPSNHCPEALNQHISTSEGTPTTTTLTGQDIDHDTLDFTISTPPAHGTLTCGGSPCNTTGDTVVGSTPGGPSPDVTYTPDAGFTGHDEFDFTASDGTNDNDATVYITVTAPVTPPTPVCSQGVDSPLLVDTTQRITGDPDSSVPGPTWALDTFSRHIQIWQETIGTDTHYCAQADDNGTFTTNGTISPQSGASLPQTVTGAMVGGTHGEVVGGTLNASQAAIADVDCTTAPSGSCDGLTSKWVAYYFGNAATYNYSPSPADSTGNWGWTYTADCGTHGQWVNQNAGNSGDIVAGNDCSIVSAIDQSIVTLMNTPIDITLSGTDSDSSAVLAFATTTNPANGTLVAGTAPTFTYTPSDGFTGSDSFTFAAGDGVSTSTGTISITVNASSGGSGNSTPNVGGGGGGGGIISGPYSFGYVNGGSSGSTGGAVLGAETETPNSCSAYLTGYMGYGKKNDPEQVRKLQTFLNTELGLSLTVSGTFDLATLNAVKQFQLKYWDAILKPWVPYGLQSDHTATGYVYKTTLREINSIECASLNQGPLQLP